MAGSDESVGRWLPAARAGSNEALGQALQSCRRYLLLVAEKGLDGDLLAKGGASDVVQETFLEAQRDFSRFAGTTEEELLAWLRQLLLHNLGDFTRRYRTDKRAARREVTLTPPDSSAAGPQPAAAQPTPSRHMMAQEQTEALQEALARLPEEYRQVLTLRFQEDRPFEEIGRLMGRSADAARKLWARALERLRQEWPGPA